MNLIRKVKDYCKKKLYKTLIKAISEDANEGITYSQIVLIKYYKNVPPSQCDLENHQNPNPFHGGRKMILKLIRIYKRPQIAQMSKVEVKDAPLDTQAAWFHRQEGNLIFRTKCKLKTPILR